MAVDPEFKPIPGTIPPPIPPIPNVPGPAMTIEFKYPLAEFVKVKNISVMGNITCAAIAFHSQGNIYLIDTGVGAPRWYPEDQLEPVSLYGAAAFPPVAFEFKDKDI